MSNKRQTKTLSSIGDSILLASVILAASVLALAYNVHDIGPNILEAECISQGKRIALSRCY